MFHSAKAAPASYLVLSSSTPSSSLFFPASAHSQEQRGAQAATAELLSWPSSSPPETVRIGQQSCGQRPLFIYLFFKCRGFFPHAPRSTYTPRCVGVHFSAASVIYSRCSFNSTSAGCVLYSVTQRIQEYNVICLGHSS